MDQPCGAHRLGTAGRRGRERRDAQHHVYWTRGAEFVGEPEDDFESAKREWIPLSTIPERVSTGEVRTANAAAALLVLHHRLLLK
jgi:hypothetical protein